MDKIEKAKNKRIYSFDVMRIMAVCAVIMIHTSAAFVTSRDNATAFLWGNFFNSISRFAVPMFLMMSGALMLNEDKEISTRKILKSAWNFFVLLVIWSVIYSAGYNIIKPIVFHEPISITTIIKTAFHGHYHLWYLFVLIGLYILTPILRLFIKRENAKLIRNYLLFFVIIGFCVPFVNELVNLFTPHDDVITEYISNFRFDYIFEYLIYYILGWYITSVAIEKKTRIFLYIGGMLGVVMTFTGAQMFWENGQNSSGYFYSNASLNIFLYGVAGFTFIYYFFKSKELKANKFILKLSNLTFGVYLIHCIFLFAFRIICGRFASPIIAMSAALIGTAIVSFISVYLISKIPILKKSIRG